MLSGEMSDSALSSLCVLRQCSTMSDLDNRPMIVFTISVLNLSTTPPHHVGTCALRSSKPVQGQAKEEKLPSSSIRTLSYPCRYRDRRPDVRAGLTQRSAIFSTQRHDNPYVMRLPLPLLLS